MTDGRRPAPPSPKSSNVMIFSLVAGGDFPPPPANITQTLRTHPPTHITRTLVKHKKTHSFFKSLLYFEKPGLVFWCVRRAQSTPSPREF
jgi:hypothetical protein